MGRFPIFGLNALGRYGGGYWLNIALLTRALAFLLLLFWKILNKYFKFSNIYFSILSMTSYLITWPSAFWNQMINQLILRKSPEVTTSPVYHRNTRCQRVQLWVNLRPNLTNFLKGRNLFCSKFWHVSFHLKLNIFIDLNLVN